MDRTWLLLTWLLLLCGVVQGNQESINQKYHDVCSGMYSKEDFNGKVDPYISFTLEELSLADEDDDGEGVSVAVFDFQDYEHIGVRLPNGKSSIFAMTTHWIWASVRIRRRGNLSFKRQPSIRSPVRNIS